MEQRLPNRQKCISDHIWEKHMRHKWGRLIDNAAAYEQWQKHRDSRKRVVMQFEAEWEKGLLGYLCCVLFGDLNVTGKEHEIKRSFLAEDSVMAWYLAIETGKFWFPAQVLNREPLNKVLQETDERVKSKKFRAQVRTLQKKYTDKVTRYSIQQLHLKPTEIETITGKQDIGGKSETAGNKDLALVEAKQRENGEGKSAADTELGENKIKSKAPGPRLRRNSCLHFAEQPVEEAEAEGGIKRITKHC